MGIFLRVRFGFLSTFLINHFDLFGLNQIMANMNGKPLGDSKFVTPLLYQISRHPLYLGFVIALWSTPAMSAGHILMAFGLTAYIFAAIPHEENDLENELGDDYREYKKKTPMLFPWLKL